MANHGKKIWEIPPVAFLDKVVVLRIIWQAALTVSTEQAHRHKQLLATLCLRIPAEKYIVYFPIGNIMIISFVDVPR